MSGQRTDNDAAIAAALAQQEQERADADLMHQLSNGGGGGGSSAAPPVVHGRSVLRTPFAYPGDRRSQQRASGSRSVPTRPSQSSSESYPSPFQQPFTAATIRPPINMCEVACIVGDGICVEMMVDSGAQTSVMSSTLARELGLESRIDRREVGVAAGVGRARISGRIRGVVCTLGNVEFDMDFVVLEVPDKLLLLGLDQLRRFKCIIDLEKEVLVFGGRDGVEVPMLPPSEQHVDWRSVMGSQCAVM